MTKPQTSELAQEKTLESILEYAKYVDNKHPHIFVCKPGVGRDRHLMGEIEKVMGAACQRSDEFERTSIELMYESRGGHLSDLPWNHR